MTREDALGTALVEVKVEDARLDLEIKRTRAHALTVALAEAVKTGRCLLRAGLC